LIRAAGPAAIVAAALAVPLFYVPAAESPFADPKLALLLVAGALGLAAWLLAWGQGTPQPGSRSVRAALAAVVVTSALAAVVAVFRRPPGAPYAAAELVRLLAIIGVAAAAAQAARDADWRRRLFDAVHVAAGIVSLIGLLQHVQLLPFAMPFISVPGSTLGNRNMAGEAVAMAIPFGFAVIAIRGRGRARLAAGIALLLAELLFLAVTRARGAWIGGALGVVAFFVVRRPALPRKALLLLIPVAAVVLAAALLPGRWHARDANDVKRYEPGARVVLDALDPASSVVRTRIGLWRRTLAMYGAHPVTGVGPGNFAVLFPKYAEPRAAADGVMSATMVPRRPHNELLERLAETGPFGLIAFVLLFGAAVGAALAAARAARGQARTESGLAAVSDVDAVSAAAGSVAACFGCGLTAFPLAMPATALLFGASLGVIDAVTARAAPVPAAARAAPPRGTAFGAAALALVLVAGGVWLSYGALESSYWRGRARAAMPIGTERPPDAPAALAALARADRAPRIDSVRFEIALRTAQVELRLNHGAPALNAADRALALEPYSPHAWATRAGAALASGDEARAAQDAQKALRLFLDLPAARTTLETIVKVEAIRRERDAHVNLQVDSSQ